MSDNVHTEGPVDELTIERAVANLSEAVLKVGQLVDDLNSLEVLDAETSNALQAISTRYFSLVMRANPARGIEVIKEIRTRRGQDNAVVDVLGTIFTK